MLQAGQGQGTRQCLCPLKGEGSHEGINDSEVGSLWRQELKGETRAPPREKKEEEPGGGRGSKWEGLGRQSKL